MMPLGLDVAYEIIQKIRMRVYWDIFLDVSIYYRVLFLGHDINVPLTIRVLWSINPHGQGLPRFYIWFT